MYIFPTHLHVSLEHENVDVARQINFAYSFALSLGDALRERCSKAFKPQYDMILLVK